MGESNYSCYECGNMERFLRYSAPAVHKEHVDARGRVLEDLGYVPDGESGDVEVRCAECDAVLEDGL